MSLIPKRALEREFDPAIYEPVKAAILQSLKGSKGKTFTELADDVVKIIREENARIQTIDSSWYTISVRLDLETRGIVETFVEKEKKVESVEKNSIIRFTCWCCSFASDLKQQTPTKEYK